MDSIDFSKLNSIEFNPEDYTVIKTQEMDDELQFKFVQFQTGYYGVISENPKQQEEEVILLSPEKGETTQINDNIAALTGGLGCISYMVFANDAKRYMENAPLELVVQLGNDAPEEYRETITRDQAKTLYEKVEICYEIMEMKIEESSHSRDILSTIFMCGVILMFLIAIVNTLDQYGVI